MNSEYQTPIQSPRPSDAACCILIIPAYKRISILE